MGYSQIRRIGRGQSIQGFEAVLGIGAFFSEGKMQPLRGFK